MKKTVLFLMILVTLSVSVFGQEEADGTGTGFFVTDNGIIITCEHVISSAAKIFVIANGERLPAKLISKNKETDVAVLSVDYKNPKHFSLRNFEGLSLGEKVAVLGFPLSDRFDDIRYTDGTLSARYGFKSDPVMFQHSAPTHPGNSGGPIFNSSYEVIGIAAQVMTAIDLLQNVGLVPQNVNFGVKCNYVTPLLGNIRLGNGNIRSVDDAELATVKIEVVKNKFTINNKTGMEIMYLEIKASDEEWQGENILKNTTFPSGTYGTTVLPDSATGRYDIYFEDRFGDFQTRNGIAIRPNQSIDLTRAAATRGARTNVIPTIKIENKTGQIILSVNVAPAGSAEWGDDRLKTNQIIENNGSFVITMQDQLRVTNKYNIRMIDDKGNTYVKMNVEIDDKKKLEFTDSDLQK